MSSQTAVKRTSLTTLQKMKERGEKFASLTAYDACFSEMISGAGVEVLLVGDSLGMVLQGHDSTLPVTLDNIVYHMECVRRGNQGAFIMADLPFMSYAHEQQALESSAALMRAGAHMVKLEGGAWLTSTTTQLAERGIPVCAHMGLTPQSINRLGGYRVQGRDPAKAQAMIDEARMLEDAGASILLLECVPVDLAASITKALEIPVIGIGAGREVDGQIMVMHDVLGISPITPKFVKNFLPESTTGIAGAITAYVQAVKNGSFPAPQHCYD
jgi:3-methyl-2-oxobutanoate hydroxymethyltransferase